MLLIDWSSRVCTGRTGEWKNYFSPELSRRIDEWIEKNLDGSDLKFTMELDYQE